jgi:hypothetical protein
MSTGDEEASPSDESVEKSIKKERDPENRFKNSIVPPFLENDGLPPEQEVSRDFESETEVMRKDDDYEELSSDKEEDTTEGEITDTNTSE